MRKTQRNALRFKYIVYVYVALLLLQSARVSRHSHARLKVETIGCCY